jgi:hypothetical protein
VQPLRDPGLGLLRVETDADRQAALLHLSRRRLGTVLRRARSGLVANMCVMKRWTRPVRHSTVWAASIIRVALLGYLALGGVLVDGRIPPPTPSPDPVVAGRGGS